VVGATDVPPELDHRRDDAVLLKRVEGELSGA
jgi:hypothetical protein